MCACGMLGAWRRCVAGGLWWCVRGCVVWGRDGGGGVGVWWWWRVCVLGGGGGGGGMMVVGGYVAA